jgi:phosphoglycerate kinase
MFIKSIRKYKKIRGKRVFLRASLNVPIKNGRVGDTFRLEKQLSTLRFLRIQGAKIIIAGHLGRPSGQGFEEKYSLLPVARYFEKNLDCKINFVPGELSLKASTAVAAMEPGDIVMLDNLRFNAGEKKNSKRFAKQLAELADIYVSDAFDNVHRADASMLAIKSYLLSFAGLLMEQELINLNGMFKAKKPLVVLLGGSKIETKLPMVKQFKDRADRILIGGALANNFLLAHGYEVGKSLIDEASLRFARSYKKENILIPVDVVTGKDDKSGKGTIKSIKDVEKDDYIFDIGPETEKLYASVIRKAQSIIWNGPMGFYESKAFRHGTIATAEAVAARSRGRCFGIVGGGETVEALKLAKLENNVDWVSTGGGAMLTFLGKMPLPGISHFVRYN